jgi:hypothetical protein
VVDDVGIASVETVISLVISVDCSLVRGVVDITALEVSCLVLSVDWAMIVERVAVASVVVDDEETGEVVILVSLVVCSLDCMLVIGCKVVCETLGVSVVVVDDVDSASDETVVSLVSSVDCSLV